MVNLRFGFGKLNVPEFRRTGNPFQSEMQFEFAGIAGNFNFERILSPIGISLPGRHLKIAGIAVEAGYDQHHFYAIVGLRFFGNRFMRDFTAQNHFLPAQDGKRQGNGDESVSRSFPRDFQRGDRGRFIKPPPISQLLFHNFGSQGNSGKRHSLRFPTAAGKIKLLIFRQQIQNQL